MATATLPDMPPLPDAFGDALGAETARDALTQNDIDAGLSGDTDNGAASSAPAGADSHHDDTGDSADDATPEIQRAERASVAGRTSAKLPKVGTLVRRSKKELAEHVIRESERAAELQRQLDELTQRAAVNETLGADVVDESIRDMVGDVVDLADAAAQLSVPKQYVTAVALESDERDRLVTLGARVAKIRAGSTLAKAAPEIALGMALVSIVLGKVIAYKLAQKESATA